MHFSISFGRVAYRQAGLLSTKFNRFLHRLPGRKYASNSLSAGANALFVPPFGVFRLAVPTFYF
jgi:hypothetical protein